VAAALIISRSSLYYRKKPRGSRLAMWLPQTAEVFYDWRGRRVHRRHNFGNYLLFSVEDKQQITVPDSVSPNTSAKTPS
jgi:hypothetical protein